MLHHRSAADVRIERLAHVRVSGTVAGERFSRVTGVEPVSVSRFDQLVGEALDALPEELGRLMDNVVVVTKDGHPTENLVGLYEGTPLTERGDYGGLVLPDVITLYRLLLCEVCADEVELLEEIGVTVVHEVAHHFGIDDESLHAWGWG